MVARFSRVQLAGVAGVGGRGWTRDPHGFSALVSFARLFTDTIERIVFFLLFFHNPDDKILIKKLLEQKARESSEGGEFSPPSVDQRSSRISFIQQRRQLIVGDAANEWNSKYHFVSPPQVYLYILLQPEYILFSRFLLDRNDNDKCPRLFGPI